MIPGCIVASSPVSTSILALGSPFWHDAQPRLPSFKCLWKPPKQELKFPFLSSRVVARKSLLSAAASTSFSSGDLNVLWRRRRRGNMSMTPKASKDGFRYPAMTKKPKWWWRSLSCLPYLMPLHKTWMYAETAYHLHPFLEDFEFLTYPFQGAIGRLPSWFLMTYFSMAYLGIVRKKEWPHYFRFHVMMGMLLEIALDVIGTVSHWMPHAVYWGKVGMHFWTAMAFAYLFTVLECMRCALAASLLHIVNNWDTEIAETRCQSRSIRNEKSWLASLQLKNSTTSSSPRDYASPASSNAATKSLNLTVHTIAQSSPSPVLFCLENAPQDSHISRITANDSNNGRSELGSGSLVSKTLQDVHIEFLELAGDNNTKKDLETYGVLPLGAFLVMVAEAFAVVMAQTNTSTQNPIVVF